MSKFLNFIEKYEAVKKPIQMIIYVTIGIILFATIIGVIFGLKSCSTPEIMEAKYFISDNVEFHENFTVNVLSAQTLDKISILKKKNDIELTTVTGNYIAVDIQIRRMIDSTKEHLLDTNDFKLKDHTGLYIPLNTIMSFFNIDAIDMHIDTDENGFIRSDVDFVTKTAVKDFSWVNKEVTNEALNITIYFKMEENFKVEENVMIFEVDFYYGKTGIKSGEDIVLVKCIKENV